MELCSIAIGSKVWASSHATIYSWTCVRHRRLNVEFSRRFRSRRVQGSTRFGVVVHVPTNVHRASRCRSDHPGALLRRTPPSTDANATCVQDIFVATDLDVRATYRVPGVNEEDRGLLWVSFAQSDIWLLTTTAPIIATPSKLALVSKDGERASGPHFTMKRREGGSWERPTFELRSDSEAQSWPKWGSGTCSVLCGTLGGLSPMMSLLLESCFAHLDELDPKVHVTRGVRRSGISFKGQLLRCAQGVDLIGPHSVKLLAVSRVFVSRMGIVLHQNFRATLHSDAVQYQTHLCVGPAGTTCVSRQPCSVGWTDPPQLPDYGAGYVKRLFCFLPSFTSLVSSVLLFLGCQSGLSHHTSILLSVVVTRWLWTLRGDDGLLAMSSPRGTALPETRHISMRSFFLPTSWRHRMHSIRGPTLGKSLRLEARRWMHDANWSRPLSETRGSDKYIDNYHGRAAHP